MTRFSSLIAVCGLCLWTALPSPALGEPVRTAIAAEIPTAEIDGFSFPRDIAGLRRTSKVDYNAPGLGFSVSYAGPGDTWADIYIYDRQENLTSGVPLALAKAEREEAIDDVRTAVSIGSYESADVLDRSEDNSFAKVHLKIRQGGKTRDSYVFVAVHRKNYVKIRLTTSAGKNADRVAEGFLAQYASKAGLR